MDCRKVKGPKLHALFGGTSSVVLNNTPTRGSSCIPCYVDIGAFPLHRREIQECAMLLSYVRSCSEASLSEGTI